MPAIHPRLWRSPEGTWVQAQGNLLLTQMTKQSLTMSILRHMVQVMILLRLGHTTAEQAYEWLVSAEELEQSW